MRSSMQRIIQRFRHPLTVEKVRSRQATIRQTQELRKNRKRRDGDRCAPNARKVAMGPRYSDEIGTHLTDGHIAALDRVCFSIFGAPLFYLSSAKRHRNFLFEFVDLTQTLSRSGSNTHIFRSNHDRLGRCRQTFCEAGLCHR